jgi:hypothetical protein
MDAIGAVEFPVVREYTQRVEITTPDALALSRSCSA